MSDEILIPNEDTSEIEVLTEPTETESTQEVQEAERTEAEEINEEIPDKAEPTIEELKAEITELRGIIAERQLLFERMSREVGEFEELFPECSLEAIPDSVWEEVRTGIPLAASYALYEKKYTLQRTNAERVNAKNSDISTGSVGKENTETFYTPEEVKAMSRSEIKANYSKILESMRKWN